MLFRKHPSLVKGHNTRNERISQDLTAWQGIAVRLCSIKVWTVGGTLTEGRTSGLFAYIKTKFMQGFSFKRTEMGAGHRFFNIWAFYLEKSRATADLMFSYSWFYSFFSGEGCNDGIQDEEGPPSPRLVEEFVESSVLELDPKSFISPPYFELHGIQWRDSCKPAGRVTRYRLLCRMICAMPSDS